jgi:hypothetical protein
MCDVCVNLKLPQGMSGLMSCVACNPVSLYVPVRLGSPASGWPSATRLHRITSASPSHAHAPATPVGLPACLPWEFKETPPRRAARPPCLLARLLIPTPPLLTERPPSSPLLPAPSTPPTPRRQQQHSTRKPQDKAQAQPLGGHGDAGGRREGRAGEEGARQGAVAAVPAARGGAGLGALARPRHLRRQHHRLRRHHVRQQLPSAARRQVRRPLPRPLLLPAAATEPAPRALLRHVSIMCCAVYICH